MKAKSVEVEKKSFARCEPARAKEREKGLERGGGVA